MRLLPKKTGKPYPVKHYVNIMLFILFTALILDFIISYASISIVKQQSTRYLRDTADLYINRINHDFAYINHYMGWTLANDEIMKTMDKSQTASTEFLKSNTQLHQRFTELQKNYGQGYNFFFYIKNKDFFLNCAPLSIQYPDYLELKKQVISYTQDKNIYERFYSEWTPIHVKNKYFIINIVPYNDSYLICLISADELIRPLRAINLGENGSVSLINEKRESISTPIGAREKQLQQNTFKPALPSLVQSQTTVSRQFSNASFRVQMIIRFGTFEKIMVAQLLIILLALIIALTLCVVMLYFNKRVLKPIQSFSDNLAQLSEGGRDPDFESSKLIELEDANLQFKILIEQIKRFKIDIYEKELDKQRIQLDYMKLQIKPHFFLNCLTNIYSMAQMQMYKEIEHMTLSTSKYFRYIFQNGQNFVRLKDEIDHVRVFLDIQQHRYRNAFRYQIEELIDTQDIHIPPLVLQTFIENAVKYAVSRVSEVQISLSVSRLIEHHEDMAVIRISDSGPGFAPSILEKLVSGHPLDQSDGNHIGIMNTLQRLELLYRRKAEIRFGNREEGGACVTLIFPFHPPESL
ncbi:sensor histidine kinase [Paenibacillus sp. HJL G12]|uniref:Sensor histidine kinase n=1 Tax=Paenibacillus dendrobii TaxID=2691084 RepID=A0A7X3IHW4_9BACL|nr:histidine kinase [Paenibacillus dendrobii]MWV44249.1 sensor histidine kinase [Paenibacillus dendrobii]